MARTLVDFRNEKGMSLKALAEVLEMTESELYVIEESGAVPEEVKERLILHYSLPDNYFTDVVCQEKGIPLKKTPKNPMKYFGIVSFVAFFIKDLVTALPTTLYTWIIMFTSISSSLKGNNVELSEEGPIWNILDTAFGSIIVVLFGILFVKYITNKTTFEGNIKKYRFLYYSWPFIVGGFVLDIAGLISSFALSNIQNSYASASAVGISLAISSVVSILSLGVAIFSAYLCARLLNVAAFGDENMQKKELRFLAILVTISTIISLVVFVVRVLLLKEVTVFTTIVTVLSKVLSVAVIWIVAIAKPKEVKSENLIYTVLPIIAICDSIVYSIVDSLII